MRQNGGTLAPERETLTPLELGGTTGHLHNRHIGFIILSL